MMNPTVLVSSMYPGNLGISSSRPLVQHYWRRGGSSQRNTLTIGTGIVEGGVEFQVITDIHSISSNTTESSQTLTTRSRLPS